MDQTPQEDKGGAPQKPPAMGHAWCRGARGGAGRREHAQGASAPGEEARRAPWLVGGPWEEEWDPFFCAVAVISVGGSEPCLEAEKWAPPSFWRARGVLTVTPLCLPVEGQTGVGPHRSPVSARAEQDGGERGLQGWSTW